MRPLPEEAVDLIKHYVGFHAKPYLDAGKLWRIGYGHTRTVCIDMVINPAQADMLLRQDLDICRKVVERLVTVSLTDGQFGALVSFVFSVGTAHFERSTLLALLNRGWYSQVPAQLMRWSKINGAVHSGLVARRQAEADLWRREIARQAA